MKIDKSRASEEETVSYKISKVGKRRYREDIGRYFDEFEVGDIYEHMPADIVLSD